MDVDAVRRAWPEVLGRVFTMRRITWTFVSQHAQVISYDGEILTLGIATAGLTNTFRQGNHAAVVRQALIDELGVDARVEGVHHSDAAGTAVAPPQGSVPRAADDPAPPDGSAPAGASPPPAGSAPAGDAQPDTSARVGDHSGHQPAVSNNPMSNNPVSNTQTSIAQMSSTQASATHSSTAHSSPSAEGWGGPERRPARAAGQSSSAPEWGSGPSAPAPDWASGTSTPAPEWASAPSSPPAPKDSAGAPDHAAPGAPTGQAVAGAAAVRDSLSAARKARTSAVSEGAGEPERGTAASAGFSSDDISDDDEDVEGLSDVGQGVVERLLGGKVIAETRE